MISCNFPLIQHSEPKFYLGEESITKSHHTGFFAMLRMTASHRVINSHFPKPVIPAKAGIQSRFNLALIASALSTYSAWIPSFDGMTNIKYLKFVNDGWL